VEALCASVEGRLGGFAKARGLDEIEEILRRPYTRVLKPNNDGTWFARVVEFAGCMTEGETAEKAIANLEEAAAAWIAVQLEDGAPIPPAPQGAKHGALRNRGHAECGKAVDPKKTHYGTKAAIVISVMALCLTIFQLWMQYRPTHQLWAYLSGLEEKNSTETVYFLLVNKGNQVEYLDRASIFDDKGCPIGVSQSPLVVSPGGAASGSVSLAFPNRAKVHVDGGSEEQLSIRFTAINQQSGPAGDDMIRTPFRGVITVHVGPKGNLLSNPAPSYTPKAEDITSGPGSPLTEIAGCTHT
jgi:predicted RNase H-like HicB family nuclease